MSRKSVRKKVQSTGNRGRYWYFLLLAFAAVSVLLWLQWTRSAGRKDGEQLPREVTFNEHVAPIVFQHCSECHRPGQPAPFPLLTFADARKRAPDILEVTQRGYMPPWLPEQPGKFMDERGLSERELAIIARWVQSGTLEGPLSALPQAPQWRADWQLGPPDLVINMPEPYLLAAAGRDVYRNFILPTRLPRARFIRALELRPGSKAVHHAFVRFDRTGECRALDEQEPGPGFGGMEIPPTAETPAGHFSGWVPGANAMKSPPGLAWQLAPGTDFVLLLHLQPTGKPEQISPTLALYFTDVPPTNTPQVLNLQSFDIDISPGATNFIVEESITLPVAAELLAVKAHAHLLGRTLEGIALFPDGTSRSLLRIPQWDFNWQTDYRFRNPMALPSGTELRLRFSYDNSTNNQRNPNHPPVRVKYGLQTSDEMAELGFQLLVDRQADQRLLRTAIEQYQLRGALNMNLALLRQNPANAAALIEAGKFSFALGEKERAETLLRNGVSMAPASVNGRYSLGVLLLDAGKLGEAEQQFDEVLRLDPRHFKARNNAGLCAMGQGQLARAEAHFREVLRFRPDDAVALGNLDVVRRALREAP